jgi:hypothetical protein
MGAIREEALDHLEHHLHAILKDMQDRRRQSDDFDWAPALAAHHLRVSMGTAHLTNASGIHAVSLSLTRQAFEALMVIDVGLISTDPARAALGRWYAGKISAGELRMWLAENAWPVGSLQGLWHEPWSQFVMQLSRALQPYSHFTPDLLQWNFNQVAPLDRDGKFVVAIGVDHVDQSRVVRLGILRGVLLWMLGNVIAQYADADPDEVGGWDLPTLATTLKSSGWLISESDWGDNLIPHLMDRPGPLDRDE